VLKTQGVEFEKPEDLIFGFHNGKVRSPPSVRHAILTVHMGKAQYPSQGLFSFGEGNRKAFSQREFCF
jgi:hypothetical protein